MPDQPQPRWHRRLAVLATAVTALPVAISLFALHGRRWVPLGDESVIAYHVDRVGTLDSPMVGVYSTRGWAHPGPILYAMLAPAWRLFGGEPINLFQSAALLNIIAICLIGWLAWRRRGLVGTVLTCGFTASLLYGLGATVYVQIWNPYVPLLFYLALLLACWGLAEGDGVLLPVAAALATIVVQMHVAYVPLVAVAALTVVGAAWLPRRDRHAFEGVNRTHLIVSAVVLVVLWIPPVWDNFFGSHNLRHLYQFFKDSKGESVGLSDGTGLLSGHVSPAGPWMGGHERVVFANVQPESLLWLGVVVGLLLVAIGWNRRRTGAWSAVAILAVGQLAAGCVAAMKVEPPVLSYLIVWMLPLAAFCWLSLALTAVDAWDTEPRADGRLSRAGAIALGLGACLLVVQTVRTSLDATDPDLPRTTHAGAVTDVLAQLQGKDLGTVRIEGVGDEFNEAWVGIVYGLDQEGVDFLTRDGRRGIKWGDEHVWRKTDRVDTTITIATSTSNAFADPVQLCEDTPGVERLALVDHMSAADRARLKELQIDNFEAEGKLPAAQADELEELSDRSYRIGVYEGDELCGTQP